MALRDEMQHRSPRDVPPVGRPRGAVWRSLQADGVVWEGQVLLVGGEVDLAARMIVTHRRVALVRGGELVLEIPRGWLRQEPVLRRDGVLELFIATPESNPFDEPMRVPLRMREGHPAAGHIIAMLAPGGVRRITPDTVSPIERARESTPAASYGGFWEGVEPVSEMRQDDFLSASRSISGSSGSDIDALVGADLPPIETPDRLIRVSSAPAQRSNGQSLPIAGLMPRNQRRSPWTLLLRVVALTVLLATAAALGAGRLNLRLPGSSGGTEAILAVPSPTASPTSTGSVPTSDPTAAANSALIPADLTAVAVGVGGPAAQSTAAAVAAAQASATPEIAPPPTAVVAIVPTEAVIPTPATVPALAGSPSSDEAGAIAADTTNAATPGESPGTPATAPLEQPAAVNSDAAPAQEMVVGPIRLALTTALRAESLPRYGLPPGSGNWVLLIATLSNEGDQPSTLAMNDLRLFDRGPGSVIDLDTGTDVIAELAGIDPARGASDSITLDPGDSTEALLLYLQPVGGSEDLALLVGQASLELAPSLAQESADAAARPDLVEAVVTGVLDGGRIAVDIDGLLRQVQYLGMAAPIGEACFAADATAANTQLVSGQLIWLERQATDRDADDTLLRDVWILDAEGNRVLVAARLLEAGAATPNPVAPDTRYQAWLAASSALARTNAAGLWGTCGEVTASGSTTRSQLLAASLPVWNERRGQTMT